MIQFVIIVAASNGKPAPAGGAGVTVTSVSRGRTHRNHHHNILILPSNAPVTYLNLITKPHKYYNESFLRNNTTPETTHRLLYFSG